MRNAETKSWGVARLAASLATRREEPRATLMGGGTAYWADGMGWDIEAAVGIFNEIVRGGAGVSGRLVGEKPIAIARARVRLGDLVSREVPLSPVWELPAANPLCYTGAAFQ
jgi:hypothetical protein